jgi:hypothetical protein
MKDLFGADIQPKELSISIYCDERKIAPQEHSNKENWIYIALLVIPDSKKSEVLDILNRYRNRNDIKYYNELKFHNLRKPSETSRSTRLAKLWLQEIVNDTSKRFYFSILGIKKDNLLFELFGSNSTPRGKYSNIYNRFFRTAFKGALNFFFPQEEYERITVSGLFHDCQGELEAHEFFPWHLPYKVGGERIVFTSERFCFVKSDHNDEPQYKDDSHFVQLTDLLVGSVSHCLDLPTKSNEGKNEIAKVILPLLKDILEGVYSGKSRFDYFRKYDISFYPSKQLNSSEFFNNVDRARSCFFKSRRILIEEHLARQLPLPFQ